MPTFWTVEKNKGELYKECEPDDGLPSTVLLHCRGY